MVSIRKAKQGFQLRRRNNNGAGGGIGIGIGGGGAPLSQSDKERLGLVVAAMIVGVLWLVFSSTAGGGGGGSIADLAAANNAALDGGANGNSNPLSPLRYRKPHPELVLQDEEDDEDDKAPLSNNKNKNNLDREGGKSRSKSQKGELNNNNNNKKKKKPQQSFVSEAFNAMALDILETLECDKLFEKSLQQLKQGNNNEGAPAAGDDFQDTPDQGGFGDYNNAVSENRRRRLEEQNQHVDDGGFENMGNPDGDTNPDEDTKEDEPDEEEEKWGREAMGNADMMKGMNDAPGFDFQQDDQQGGGEFEDDLIGYNNGMTKFTAKHLFCLAAMQEPPTEIVSQFSCEASGRKRKTLLDLWTAARAQISDVKLLQKVLDVAEEHQSKQILERSYNLWAPTADTGMTYMVNTLNNELLETLNSLEPSLGPGKLFVDVGSGMGLTTLAISQKYPGTKIVSIEPASPNWLLQELNLRCNLAKHEFTKIKVVLAGVGPNTDDEDNMMAKLMWRPSSTTSSRAWTPAGEFGPEDVELLVRLRKLRSILAEADVYIMTKDASNTPNMMDVLNLDCQGCEYNLIPALTEEEFDAIPNVMGSVHWGYIPVSKLPSSQRGKQTHDRLCQHETIAKTTKECCGSLNVPVKSNIPGEVLYRDNGPENLRDEVVTVSDIIQEGLCDDYDSVWAAEHYVNAIKDDWGWFELSSQAQ